jgi:SAM-dependent methyltransferase
MSTRTTYDEVRYSNFPYAQTHPDRLATVGALHGLRTPDPATARVLEIGCGAGGNVIAMAVSTPGVTAVGVDLAATAIEEGRRAIEAVGITNAELRQGDISDLRGGQLGEFDFIVAHGVYAWIPEPVRDHLLEAIHSHLAADGLAFVSYNANPGGHMRRALREMGLWNAGDAQGPVAVADRAQELYRFVWENRAGTKDWWGGLLESQLDSLAHGPTHRLVHDELGEFWAPAWFSDVVRRAAAAGLAYVGDADLATMLPDRIPHAVAVDLEEFVGGDRLEREQLIDILRCAFFRMSVLCRDSLRPQDGPVTEALHDLHYGSRPDEPGAEPAPGLLGSVLALLRSRAPDTVPFAELRAATDADPGELCEALRDGFLAELVMPHRTPLRAVAVADVARPHASPLARWQALSGHKEITSMAYTSVRMEERAARLLLGLLDGTRDRDAIRSDFREQTGVAISPEDLETNLDALAKIFLLSES